MVKTACDFLDNGTLYTEQKSNL